ncbi:hypothetical protein ACFV9E_37745 [Streptomyces sp. NPDC059835]|uniref:hypothetical protein n=1 Tax=Streptomyces sp. NPDC059835 TaxID=3346967 RepID=UPI00366321B6
MAGFPARLLSGCGSQLCALDDGAAGIAVTLSALGNPPDLVPVGQSFRETAVTWLPQVPDSRHPGAAR